MSQVCVGQQCGDSVAQQILCLGAYQAKSKGSAGLRCLLEALEKNHPAGSFRVVAEFCSFACFHMPPLSLSQQ